MIIGNMQIVCTLTSFAEKLFVSLVSTGKRNNNKKKVTVCVNTLFLKMLATIQTTIQTINFKLTFLGRWVYKCLITQHKPTQCHPANQPLKVKELLLRF